MKKYLILAADAAFIALILAGFYFGSDGAANVVKFTVYATFIFSLIILFIQEEISKAPSKLTMPRWYIVSDVAVCVFLMVWAGHMVLAGLHLASMVFMYGTSRHTESSLKNESN